MNERERLVAEMDKAHAEVMKLNDTLMNQLSDYIDNFFESQILSGFRSEIEEKINVENSSVEIFDADTEKFKTECGIHEIGDLKANATYVAEFSLNDNDKGRIKETYVELSSIENPDEILGKMFKNDEGLFELICDKFKDETGIDLVEQKNENGVYINKDLIASEGEIKEYLDNFAAILDTYKNYAEKYDFFESKMDEIDALDKKLEASNDKIKEAVGITVRSGIDIFTEGIGKITEQAIKIDSINANKNRVSFIDKIKQNITIPKVMPFIDDLSQKANNLIDTGKKIVPDLKLSIKEQTFKHIVEPSEYLVKRTIETVGKAVTSFVENANSKFNDNISVVLDKITPAKELGIHIIEQIAKNVELPKLHLEVEELKNQLFEIDEIMNNINWQISNITTLADNTISVIDNVSIQLSDLKIRLEHTDLSNDTKEILSFKLETTQNALDIGKKQIETSYTENIPGFVNSSTAMVIDNIKQAINEMTTSFAEDKSNYKIALNIKDKTIQTLETYQNKANIKQVDKLNDLLQEKQSERTSIINKISEKEQLGTEIRKNPIIAMTSIAKNAFEQFNHRINSSIENLKSKINEKTNNKKTYEYSNA